MKELYQKVVEVFVKVTKQNSNHMHLACILTTSQATQMKAKRVRMQAQYHEDERFQSHGLTSWPHISEMFLDNLTKMAKNASIDWATHFEFALL